MTGQITDPPAGYPAPTRYFGICDVCRVAKLFTSERTRDLWEKFHPHEEDDGE